VRCVRPRVHYGYTPISSSLCPRADSLAGSLACSQLPARFVRYVSRGGDSAALGTRRLSSRPPWREPRTWPRTNDGAGGEARGHGGRRRTARSRWAREAVSRRTCAPRAGLVGWATGGVARGGVHGWGWRLRTRVATPRERVAGDKGMLRTCFA